MYMLCFFLSKQVNVFVLLLIYILMLISNIKVIFIRWFLKMLLLLKKKKRKTLNSNPL